MALLNQSLNVVTHTLATRIVMPPMATRKVGEDGFANRAMATYYGARATAGGFGLIQTEHHYVSADGRAGLHQPSASRDDDVPALALTADAVHAGDAPVMLQINHAGSAASSQVTAATPLGPSAVAKPTTRGDAELPREMTGVPPPSSPRFMIERKCSTIPAAYATEVDPAIAPGILLTQ